MQEKGTVDEAEEAFVVDKSTNGDRKSVDRKDSNEDPSKKEVTKDGKFAFRKMKQPKKEKSDKNSPSRFEGDGISFKAKLIGVEIVSDARGDKMCQDTMQRLKLNVRNTGPHKRKISVCVSLQGIKIKDDKSGEVMYHHPVPSISFISQDITDARAFGYVFGSSNGRHQFIAIKTEKPAFHVVLALRDLFQTVLNWKQEKMEQVKEKADESETASSIGSDSISDKSSVQEHPTKKTFDEEKMPQPENIYFDVILTEPFELKDPELTTETVVETKEPVQTIDDLLCLQDELNKLQQGIEQMDTSIAAAAFNLGLNPIKDDPFDTSFVTPGGPKKDGFPHPLTTPVPLTTSVTTPSESKISTSENQMYTDKYAVFSAVDAEPSVFESTTPVNVEDLSLTQKESEKVTVPELNVLEEEIKIKSTAPAKPPRQSKQAAPDLAVFAELDPLGKDRPYKDKTEFFQDVKNPPKKVLNDLVDKSSSSGEEFVSRAFDTNFGSPPTAFFPAGLDAVSSSSPFPAVAIPSLSSSLPNSFMSNLNFSVAPQQNGNVTTNPYNPFDKLEVSDPYVAIPRSQTRASEPIFPNLHSPPSKNTSPNAILSNSIHFRHQQFSNHSPPSKQQFILSNGNLNPEDCALVHSNCSTLPSNPIPIPTRQHSLPENKITSFSNSNFPYSKSPASFDSESPNQTEHLDQNISEKGGGLLMIKNELNSQSKIQNNSNSDTTHSTDPSLSATNTNSNLTSKPISKSQNGVSRPRPRSLLSKTINPLPVNGLTLLSHSPNVPVSENEIINRENMKSIAKVLLTNGYRPHSKSLPTEPHNDFKLALCGEKNIFAQKTDPFGDDFFCSLPKKVTNHHTKTEIQDYV